MQNQIISNQKARAYVRVSTLKESQKDSPEHQEGMIRETAAGEGVTIQHVYLDRGTATNIIERDDVQRLVSDAKRGEYNTIYFASLSRFSRDTLDAISLKRMLVNALGIRVVSIEDLYDSAKEDNEMVFTIISSVNQKQAETISISSKRGIRQSARKGNFTGSIAPFGYRKVNVDGRKTLEIVPEQADIVRKIFDLYVNKNMGEKGVTKYLNDDLEIKSPKGGIWGVTSVQRILQNENYTGYFTFCKLETKKVYEDLNDLQNRRKKLVLRDSSLWEKTDFQTHPAIIDPDLYHKAQEMRDLRGGGKRGGRRSYVNVFAKLIFCKECGSAMVTMSSTSSTGKSYRYLMCSKRRRQGNKGCANMSWMPYYETREIIVKNLIELIKTKIGLAEAAKTVQGGFEYLGRDFDKEIKKLEKTISDNRRLLYEVRRQNMLEEISNSQYEFERTQYENDIADAEKRLLSLTKKSEDSRDIEVTSAKLGHAIKMLEEADLDDVEYTRNILLQMAQRIEVTMDGEVDLHTVLGSSI